MKTLKKTSLLLIMTLLSQLGIGQENVLQLKNQWQIGIGLGEIPSGGSFKPSISVGYYFSEKIYAGLIYQFKDHIQRDNSSINAKSSGLDGLIRAAETVNQRFLLQMRYTPFKNGPYLSTGIVFNGQDTETMSFDNRTRSIADAQHSGDIVIKQTRPAGWGLALGLGYQYNFKNGLSAGFEWTPAWGQYPNPIYQFASSENLTNEAKAEIQKRMDEGFKSSVTNMYKVFHIGLAYRFK